MSGNNKGQFKTNFGFLMAAVGSAVGLGNLWGFPYKMGNGGGFAFLILYLALAVLIGYPCMIGEFAIGRKAGKAAIGSYESIDIFEHAAVLHFGHTNNGGAHRELVLAKLGKDFRHVLLLGLILHSAPFVRAVGQKLPVVLALVVDRIEEVFQIVESYAVKAVFFLGKMIARRHQSEKKHYGGERKNGLFHIAEKVF